MKTEINDLILNRIQETHDRLINKNKEYSTAAKENKELAKLMPVFTKLESEETKISSKDCENFEKYMHNNFITAAIIEQETYKQGFRDCIWLMKYLKIRF